MISVNDVHTDPVDLRVRPAVKLIALDMVSRCQSMENANALATSAQLVCGASICVTVTRIAMGMEPLQPLLPRGHGRSKAVATTHNFWIGYIRFLKIFTKSV